ncbi:MAG: DUF4912 domain-containing protein [Verrucomicrobia subdivision 3 bacterium]|nr:DUF4912 domain-containing protein [Limisphaerales bacterium]
MKSGNSKKKTPKNGNGPAKAKRPVEVPPILLEGDATTTTTAGGPGRRYAVPTPGAPSPAAATQELPEAYGTKKLLLAARDPHWLYAHWDLTRDQLREYNGKSADGHLVLRVYKDNSEGEPVTEQHVHPESKNWFVNVPSASTKYAAELGYYAKGGNWTRISVSAPTLTPPDAVSEDASVWFETLPVDLQFQHLLQLVKSAVSENVPLLEAIQQLRATGFKGLPDPRAVSSGKWTREQERALGELITIDSLRRVWMGSLEITELIRRQLQQQISSAMMAEFAIPSSWSGAIGSVTSPYGYGERRKGFWFNVNAELIIYGATEPDAEVTIGGKKIRLRSDGTFSYRFALPDGKYGLPAIARSADGTDSRSADLNFSRMTEYRGDVGKHPQDPRLKAPLVENVS